MDDLISRRAVIEINRSYHGWMPNEVNHSIWKEINELPSAQPNHIADISKKVEGDTISRQMAIDALRKKQDNGKGDMSRFYNTIIQYDIEAIMALPSTQPELTDEQSIAHLQSSGWMQRHDKEMYESGLKEQLADDSDSYDNLLPTVQPERIWHSCKTPPKHHKDVLVRGTEAIGNVTIYRVMQWDVDAWRPTDYAPSIIWEEWSEI